MALLGGSGGGSGVTLWMTVSAKDNTKEAFDRASANMDKLANVALRTTSRIGSVATSFATLGRITGMLNDEQARAIGVFGVAINIMSSVGMAVKALTTIEWGFVAAKTWSVSSTTLGIGVAIAAAAAISVLAMQTNKAAEAQGNYNQELEKGTSLQRRRGTDQRIVSRSGYTEILD